MKRTIEISEETYEKLKDQLTQEEMKPINDFEDMIGQKYFFRTVTYHLVGRVTKKIGQFFQLEGCSWVADSGRFMNAIKNGVLDEVEPLGVGFVNIETLTDFFPWNHDLPTEQK